jgi:orotate phosphoribosyltransferase
MLGMLMFTLMQTTDLKFPVIHRAPQKDWYDFLGYKIASRVGMPACAVMTSEGIAHAAKLGCDVLTYKTIRCHAWPAHPQPNIVYVDRTAPLTHDDIGKTIKAHSNEMHEPDDIGVANSFGIQSMDPELTKKDIQKAKQSLLEGQVLIVSIFGNTLDEWIKTAQLAVESGADIIEANFSCPNLHTNNEPVYTRPEDIFLITQTLVQTIPVTIPIILKFGVCSNHEVLEQTLIAAARAGAQGICGINSVPMKVVNADGAPTFGTRVFAGVSGMPIRQLALDFIKIASTIIHKENLNLVLLGVGGITMPSHFSQFFAAGATVALSATGMMHNPYLIADYHEQSQAKQVNKQELANKLFDIGVIKFGDFVFKSGIRSNNYVDMRLVMSYPDILHDIALCLNDIQQQCHADLLCPVPYAAVPVTTMLSMVSGVPMVMARQQTKDHGTKKMIEGVYTQGQECLIIEDVITTGASILETIKVVEAAGLKVKDVVGIIDRQQGGEENITSKGYRFHAVFTLQELLNFL